MYSVCYPWYMKGEAGNHIHVNLLVFISRNTRSINNTLIKMLICGRQKGSE